jgi:glutamate-ammonia-ligase adenylyltransferase
MPGGLVDIEFIVHALQLATGTAMHPQLSRAIDAFVVQGLVSAQFAGAHDFFSRLLIIIRLVAPDCIPPALPARALIARCLGCDDWQTVEKALATNASVVLEHWLALFGSARSTAATSTAATSIAATKE